MNLIEGIKKYKSRNFMEAVVAGCAIISYADGLVQSEELAKLMDYFRIDERLKLFDVNLAIDTFNKFVEDFEFDPRLGRENAFKSIRKINKNQEEARLVVLVCCAVGKADEEFTESEKKVIREICLVMGLNPAEFDLNQIVSSGRKSAEIPKPLFPESAPPLPKRPEKKSDIPEWMKHPPAVPKPSQSHTPDWMRKLPDSQKKKENNIPEWMKKARSSDKKKSQDNKIPEWMRKKGG